MLLAWFLPHWYGGTWEQESLPLGWVGWDSVRGWVRIMERTQTWPTRNNLASSAASGESQLTQSTNCWAAFLEV